MDPLRFPNETQRYPERKQRPGQNKSLSAILKLVLEIFSLIFHTASCRLAKEIQKKCSFHQPPCSP